MALFLGLPWWAGIRKVKPIWNLLQQETVSSSGISWAMQVCTLIQTDNHASTRSLFFYRPDALPATQPTASKHWRQMSINIKTTVQHPLQLINVVLNEKQCLQCFGAVGWVAGRASGLQKTEWWGAGVVLSLKRDADLHMAQMMPLPLTVSCFSKIQIGFTFLVLANLGSPRKRAITHAVVVVVNEKLSLDRTFSKRTHCASYAQMTINPVCIALLDIPRYVTCLLHF